MDIYMEKFQRKLKELKERDDLSIKDILEMDSYEYHKKLVERAQKEVDEEEKEDSWPEPLVNPYTTSLSKSCEKYLYAVANDTGEMDDLQHYIFEEAMMAIYGTDVFKWINKQI